MIDNDFDDLKLFITGPTYIRREVREAALLPEFGHRDSENAKRTDAIFSHLRTLAGAGETYEPILFNGSGSSGLEASIRSLVAADETVLNVSVGAFGDLYHKLAVLNGKKAVQLKFDYGQVIDLARLEQALAEHKPAVVTFTHNETSTGVIHEIAPICNLIRKYGALPLVDGVSILGCVPIDLEEARPAMYCSATQKGLALPAGFGIGYVGEEALRKAEKVDARGYATDILAQIVPARKGQALSTPNTTLLNQMYVQLRQIVEVEGIEKRFARHEEMREIVAAFVSDCDGYDFFAPEESRSPALTSVLAPGGVTVARLKEAKEALRAKGYLFDPGYGKLNVQLEEKGRRVCFRIGHMGDITPEMLREYLKDLRPVLESMTK